MCPHTHTLRARSTTPEGFEQDRESETCLNHVYKRLKTQTENLNELIFYMCVFLFVVSFFFFKKAPPQRWAVENACITQRPH